MSVGEPVLLPGSDVFGAYQVTTSRILSLQGFSDVERESGLRWRTRSSVKSEDVYYYQRRNKRTNNSEKDVPGGLLFGLRFRFSLPSNSLLVDCVAFVAVSFAFSFDFELIFCTFWSKEADEGVNVSWNEGDDSGLEVGLRVVVSEGWVWK